MVTPLKTLMGFSVHLNVQLKFYNLPYIKDSRYQFNQFTGLFVATVIELDRYRWQYGIKWRPARMKDSVIMLPATSAHEPDWSFMESYIKNMIPLNESENGEYYINLKLKI